LRPERCKTAPLDYCMSRSDSGTCFATQRGCWPHCLCQAAIAEFRRMGALLCSACVCVCARACEQPGFPIQIQSQAARAVAARVRLPKGRRQTPRQVTGLLDPRTPIRWPESGVAVSGFCRVPSLRNPIQSLNVQHQSREGTPQHLQAVLRLVEVLIGAIGHVQDHPRVHAEVIQMGTHTSPHLAH
jgi:hypothetical protein